MTFKAGWWYAVGKVYDVREVLGQESPPMLSAPTQQMFTGPQRFDTEDARDDALSLRLMDLPLETRIYFRGPYETAEAAQHARELEEHGVRWLVKIEGTSMLAPYLSPLGAEDPDNSGKVFEDEEHAHDFGSQVSAQAWIDGHPAHPGQVVVVPGHRTGHLPSCSASLGPRSPDHPLRGTGLTPR